MKRIILGVFLVGGFLSATQAEEKSLPPPSSPALHRADDFAAWTIQFSYEKEKQDAPVPTQDRIKSQSIQKTGKIYSVLTAWQSGKTSEKWNIEGLQLQTAPDSSVVALLPRPESGEFAQPDHEDFSRSDFPELAWLSLEDYRGIETYQGKPCYLFVREKEGQKLTVKLTDKQLPLEFQSDKGIQTYTMNASPKTTLVPPASFQKTLAAYQRGRDALKRQASPP